MPKPKYATRTTVSESKSKMEIDKLLKNHGASQRIIGTDDDFGQIAISFKLNNRCAKIKVLLPELHDFARNKAGHRRSPSAQKSAHEAECRRIWRALLLVLKAKLEGIASGILTFEQEFLAHLLLSDGRTLGEFIAPQLENAFNSGQMPKQLLPGM